MISATFFAAATMSFRRWPDSSTSLPPSCTLFRLSAISSLISRAAVALRCERLRTSDGHYGEATAMLTGAGSFDRRIQRQQVGLERDLVDDTDDVADLRARGIDLGHGGNGARDDPPPLSACSRACTASSLA